MTHCIAHQYGYYVILSFCSVVIGVNDNDEVNSTYIIVIRNSSWCCGKRKLIVSITVPHEDPHNRGMDETVCSEVTLRWWGIGKGQMKRKSRVNRTTKEIHSKMHSHFLPAIKI